MGKRGPQPGFKKARAAQAAAPSSLPEDSNTKPAAAAQQALQPTPPAAQPKATKPKAEPIALSAADLENPNKLSGQALRDLAHRRGLAKSILATMPDEKIRMELRYIAHRQYGSDDALA